MRTTSAIVLAAALLSSALCSASSDGYIGWDEVSFKDGAGWSVHIAQTRIANSDHDRISVLEISHNGLAIDIPESATNLVRDPLLNGVKLLNVCCSDAVKLQIPVLEFKPNGSSTKRIWEISIEGGKFIGANFRTPSAFDGSD